MGNCWRKPANRHPAAPGSVHHLIDSVSEPVLLACIQTKLADVSCDSGRGTRSPSINKTAAESVAEAVVLHHRSIEKHLLGIVRWTGNVAQKNMKKKRKGFVVVAAAADLRRLGREYGKLVELMLEHAQMEERLLFPALERTQYRGICGSAFAEHACDLPMMNGIKEDIKALLALDSTSPFLHEAIINLHRRFKTLQEHCRVHFLAEEKELLPLLEATERSEKEEGKEPWRWMEQIISIMEATHGHLFPFIITGLHPEEAIRYIDLICGSTDKHKVTSMLQSLASWLQDDCQC